MGDLRAALEAGDGGFCEAASLGEFMLPQRWFGAKAKEVIEFSVLEVVPIRSEAPMLAIVLLEARFAGGTSEVYQLPLGVRPVEDRWSDLVVVEIDGWTVYDALADPLHAADILHLIQRNETIDTPSAAVEFRSGELLTEVYGDARDVRPIGAEGPPLGDRVRPMGAEQSNSSVVVDEKLVLKLYRKLDAGVNPELELTAFLTERGFRNMAPLMGHFGLVGGEMEGTLGIVQAFVPAGRDGWALVLDGLTGERVDLAPRIRRLGEVTGEMHGMLGSGSQQSGFSPEEPSEEKLGLLAATLDEEIEQVFLHLPDWEVLRPILGRGEEVREEVHALSYLGGSGLQIRNHGDYHLGQILWADGDWFILDFEGEPARGFPERRVKRSPLRDVAGMLRSFAYVATAARLLRGVDPPEEWEEEARRLFMEGYMATVDASLLPAGLESLERLLAVFELEKAVYELRYELNHRPDWVRIPVAGIMRLLDKAGG